MKSSVVFEISILLYIIKSVKQRAITGVSPAIKHGKVHLWEHGYLGNINLEF